MTCAVYRLNSPRFEFGIAFLESSSPVLCRQTRVRLRVQHREGRILPGAKYNFYTFKSQVYIFRVTTPEINALRKGTRTLQRSYAGPCLDFGLGFGLRKDDFGPAFEDGAEVPRDFPRDLG
jgi:hypothetical protein